MSELVIHASIDTVEAANAVVTIGNFDGVHKGHRTIIDKTVNLAKQYDGQSVLITFWPHPREVIRPDLHPNLKFLSLIDEKKELLSQTSLNHMVIVPFTEAFSRLTYIAFIEDYLVKKLNARHLVLGYNHHFGKNREGNFDNVKEVSENYGFKVDKVEQLKIEDEFISSSTIRRLITEGEIAKANQLLGYTYFLDGMVGAGKRLGRTIGFPTANIQHVNKKKLIPSDGVYAVQVKVGNSLFDGMANIGTKPTVNNDKEKNTVEVHIFNFSEDIYSKKIRLFFIDRIRNEMKFKNLEELKTQLIKDQESAKKMILQKKSTGYESLQQSNR